MVFSSPTFLFAFLPLTLLGLVAIRNRTFQNTWLLAMSVLFYVWGGGAAVFVLVYVVVVSFFAAMLPWSRLRMAQNVGPYRLVLAVSIFLILIPLLFFKYIPPLAHLVASDYTWAAFALPLGISFFTFHGISYLVDTARGQIDRERSFRDYSLYLFVFPHQIAGPIVRYSEIRSELKRNRNAPLPEVTLGLARFGWGLTKKVVVADPCGRMATDLFALSASGVELSAADAWLGAFLFAMQIYFDFSGYSDMAIGLALILGFHFPENFYQPYRSISITDFWRRWHVTLSRWFRDYVYIPMGGNRKGPVMGVIALLTVFLLTALWHGAALTFLIWGGLHSAMLLIERFTGIRRTERFAVIRRALIFVFVVISWVPFRAQSTDALWAYWGSMFGGSLDGFGPTVLSGFTPFLALAVVIGIASLFGPRGSTGFGTVFGGRSVDELALVRWKVLVPTAAVLFLVAITIVLWSDFSPFLYFQF